MVLFVFRFGFSCDNSLVKNLASHLAGRGFTSGALSIQPISEKKQSAILIPNEYTEIFANFSPGISTPFLFHPGIAGVFGSMVRFSHFSNFLIFWKLSLTVSVPLIPVSFLELLVEWEAPVVTAYLVGRLSYQNFYFLRVLVLQFSSLHQNFKFWQLNHYCRVEHGRNQRNSGRSRVLRFLRSMSFLI